jgi:CBS domain-containing protein
MDIRSVMTANPATCSPDATLRQVAQLMRDNDCGQIPVVGQDRHPLGVITDRDIAVRAVAVGSDPASATAREFMSSPATTVPAQSSLNDVAMMMEENQIRRVVVVDEQGSVAGIVAQADIARAGRDRKTAEVVKQVSQPSRSS